MTTKRCGLCSQFHSSFECPKPSGIPQIFVRGISRNTTNEDLRAHFVQYGSIKDARVVLDKVTNESRGFGFVTFSQSQACQRALNDTHNLHGNELKLSLSVLMGPKRNPCRRCGQLGHGVGECTWVGEEKTGVTYGSGLQNSKHCHNCHQVGHLPRECPNKQPYTSSAPPSSTGTASHKIPWHKPNISPSTSNSPTSSSFTSPSTSYTTSTYPTPPAPTTTIAPHSVSSSSASHQTWGSDRAEPRATQFSPPAQQNEWERYESKAQSKSHPTGLWASLPNELWTSQGPPTAEWKEQPKPEPTEAVSTTRTLLKAAMMQLGTGDKVPEEDGFNLLQDILKQPVQPRPRPKPKQVPTPAIKPLQSTPQAQPPTPTPEAPKSSTEDLTPEVDAPNIFPDLYKPIAPKVAQKRLPNFLKISPEYNILTSKTGDSSNQSPESLLCVNPDCSNKADVSQFDEFGMCEYCSALHESDPHRGEPPQKRHKPTKKHGTNLSKAEFKPKKKERCPNCKKKTSKLSRHLQKCEVRRKVDDDDDDDDLSWSSGEEFEVESVIDVKVEDGVRYYKLHWKEWDSSYDSWEPEEQLQCIDLIQAFERTRR